MKVNEIITETTSSGSIAVVVGGPENVLYRNPSIYDNVGKYTEYKKKKPSKKTKQEK